MFTHIQFHPPFGTLFGPNIAPLSSKTFVTIFDPNISLRGQAIFDPNKILNC